MGSVPSEPSSPSIPPFSRTRSTPPAAVPLLRRRAAKILCASVILLCVPMTGAFEASSSFSAGGTDRWRRRTRSAAAAAFSPPPSPTAVAVVGSSGSAQTTKKTTTALRASADGDYEKDDAAAEKFGETLPSASSGVSPSQMAATFDAAVAGRYACTRFRRHEEPEKGPPADDESETKKGKGKMLSKSASISNPAVVRQALRCLDLSRRAPTGFNAQPYRVVLVHTPDAKEALASACLGRNADRVRDSDATAVFLADREWGRDWARFGTFLQSGGGGRRRSGGKLAARPPPGKWMRRKIRVLILLFSSGYPLPRVLASPLSFLVRTAVVLAGTVLGRLGLLVPTLSSAETWSTKNVSLVAMSYLLGCTSRGLATCPMEGYWAPGVRGALGVPRRYAVPLIVSTGVPYRSKEVEEEEEADDVGMSHGAPGTGSAGATPRYPLGDVVFGDSYGKAILLPL